MIAEFKPGIATSILRALRNAPARRLSAGAQRGAAATELAVVLPLLIFFGLATVDVGRFAYVAIQLDNAVRVGAERGATRSFSTHTHASWESDMKGRINEELADLKNGWLKNVQVTVTATSTSNNLARVKVSADGEFATLFDWPFASSLSGLHREISIRQFR